MAKINVERIVDDFGDGDFGPIGPSSVFGADDVVVFDSQITPQQTYSLQDLARNRNDPKPVDPVSVSGPKSFLADSALRLVRPKVTIRVRGQEYQIAPYGEPERKYKIAVALIAGLAAIGAAYAVNQIKRKILS